MNYIEELSYGDTFRCNGEIFLITQDFRKNGSRLAINMADSSPRWIEPSQIIDKVPVYILDDDNNIIALKQEKNNATNINLS